MAGRFFTSSKRGSEGIVAALDYYKSLCDKARANHTARPRILVNIGYGMSTYMTDDIIKVFRDFVLFTTYPCDALITMTVFKAGEDVEQ